MKFKVVVVDLELSPRTKRWAVRLVVPALLLLGATVAYAVPKVAFVQGTPLRAADLNENFTDLDMRLSSLQTNAPHATEATHAAAADTATEATHAASASVASALAPGGVDGALMIYTSSGSPLPAPCAVGSGFSIDCTCPMGSFVVSGGGFAFAGQGTLRESRALNPTTWRTTCWNGTADVMCGGYTLVCSRIGPTPMPM
jgi:hypothetical protein